MKFYEMDVQTALVCVGVFIVSAVVVYLISVLGIKERTFEEAIEEQKRRSQEEVVLLKTEKPKKDKKFKKWSRQKKEKNSDKYQDEELTAEKCDPRDRVEFKPEPEIIAESDGELKPAKTKKQKVNTAKPILIKKVESRPEPETEEFAEISNSKINHEFVRMPKEIADEPRKLSEPTFIKEKQNQEIKMQSEMQIVEPELAKEVPVISSIPKKKKPKLEHFENGDVISGSKLLNLIKNAILTDVDIQTMIEFLLNKQGEASGWMKKNDPVTSLKKQLQEKEQALEVEQKQTQAATSKLRELRKELNQEKSKLVATEQSSREKINQLQQEIQALQLRMKSSHEQHVTETSTVQNKLQQLQTKLTEITENNTELLKEKSTLESSLSKLEYENKSHSEEITKLQSELKDVEDFQSEYERRDKDMQLMQKSKECLEEKNKELENRLQELISTHEIECKDLQQKLSNTNSQLKSMENTYSVINQELNDKKSNCSDLETDNTTLLHKLQAMEGVVKDREQELKKLQANLEEACIQRTELESRLEQLQNKLEELTKNQELEIHQVVSIPLDHENLSHFPNVGERTSAEGEEAPHYHQNGDVHQEMDNSSQKKVLELSEHERIVEEKEATLQRLWEEVNTHKSTIATISEELASQKKKNNELREKNWKAMEALSSAEKTAESKIEQLKKETEERIMKSQREAELRIEEVKKQYSQNGKMEENFVQDLKQAKERAEQNFKSVEQRLVEQNLISEKRLNQVEELQLRLQELETIVPNKTKELNKEFETKVEAINKNERELLQRIFPDVKINEPIEHSLWLCHFEREALNKLNMIKSSSTSKSDNDLEKKLEETRSQLTLLREEKEKTVQHYKTVLAETEDILNKLQNSVENEEMEWKKKMNLKDQEIERVGKENKELIAEKMFLEAKVKQLQGVEETTSEMQAKLKELQVKLEGEETERKVLKEKLEEANQSALNFKEEINAKSKEVEELRKERESFESTKNELQQIKVQLEKEKKATKDLSTQTVKLNSLVKIGQDALRAEQETVKELQVRLQSVENKNLNGPGINDKSEECESETPLIKKLVTKKRDVSGKK